MSSLAATSVLALFWIIGTIRNFPVQEGNTECFLRTFFLEYICYSDSGFFLCYLVCKRVAVG
jgi:hypothetical protein